MTIAEFTEMSNDDFDVIVVGAGCSGLSAAKCLSDLKIKVLEKDNHIGGRVESRKLDKSNVETGALFPILEESNPNVAQQNSNINNQYKVEYIREDGEVMKGETIYEILEQINYDNALKNYTEQTKVINQQLGLKVRNKDYGEIEILNKQQQDIVKAVYQITHCGDIKGCLKNIRPLTIKNISEPNLNNSNTNRLEKYFSQQLKDVELNVSVKKIETFDSHCNVTTVQNGRSVIYRSKYVLASCPPPQIFSCIEDINIGSLEFYSNARYEAGTVCVMQISGRAPESNLMINSHELWSACFISLVSSQEYIVHIYIPHCRDSTNKYTELSIDDVYDSIRGYLPNDNKLKGGIIKNWKYLSPSLSQDMMKKYLDEHYKLTPRVWYCGELASFDPKNIYTFGTRAALTSGKSVALKLKNLIQNKGWKSLTGLFDSELYKLTEDQPLYVRSRVDGNIAYYGVIASAYKDEEMIEYLCNNNKNFQWEFHESYGPTLEDSLLVVEGLLDTIGVSKVREQIRVGDYIDNYLSESNQLFTTLKNGSSSYWNGPSLVGNAHMLYILEKLQIDDHRINKQLIIEFLYGLRKPNGLWESKWFTNSFYSSFYIIRALLINHDTHPILDIEEMISIIEQALLIYSASEHSIISKSYIIRSIILLIGKAKVVGRKTNNFNQIIELCKKITNEMKTIDTNLNSESLLYYWQDIKGTSKADKLFITSKPKPVLVKAMISIAYNELEDIVKELNTIGVR